ncbi:MAG: hypothetical protein IJD49_04345 [Clostridia bacterium]|nr:hypothetical protein [Clostridia bacterium]
MKFTDNKIIKVLECCTNSLDCPAVCPLYEYAGDCFLALHKPTLDLINRQKAEIERFKKIETTINAFWCELQKLSIAKEKETPTLEELLEYIEQAKAEAIKEFAKRLKGEYKNRCMSLSFERCIDNLVKEMAGDAE